MSQQKDKDNGFFIRAGIAVAIVAAIWLYSTGKLDDFLKPGPKPGPSPDVSVIDQDAQFQAICVVMARHLRSGEIKNSRELLDSWRAIFRLSIYGDTPSASVSQKSKQVELDLKSALGLTDSEIVLDATKSEDAARVFDRYATT